MSEITETGMFKELCENDFSFYCEQFLKVIEPETEFEWNWHMNTLCNHCEMVYYGEIQNLDINIPPRMMKSLIVNVLFPTWVWTKRPSLKFIAASRSYDLSVKFNQQRRDLILSPAYNSIWGLKMKADTNTSIMFMNQFGGFMKAASALGKLTGMGADFLLSDDLLDVNDAFSRAKREALNRWYSNSFYNRAQNKKTVKRINVNQRLHVDDVSGNIEKNHNYKKLVIDMQRQGKQMSNTGFVDPRKEGEFIFPSRYGQDEMNDDYKALGVYGWSSQHQQQPRPAGGGIIKEEWIRRYSEAPKEFDKKIITADLTFKAGQSTDYVCFQYWGRKDKNKYLLDIVRGRWSYAETKRNFIQFCDKNKATLKYIEDKANGPALISDLGTEITGLKPWPEKGSKYMNADKVQRLHLTSQEYENGMVYLPKDIELVELFIEELLSFTESGSTMGHDDMVDTSTMALIELKHSESFIVG